MFSKLKLAVLLFALSPFVYAHQPGGPEAGKAEDKTESFLEGWAKLYEEISGEKLEFKETSVHTELEGIGDPCNFIPSLPVCVKTKTKDDGLS